MYGILLGVTPPDTLYKMNSDNYMSHPYTICYDMILHDYDMMLGMCRLRNRESYEAIPLTTLGLPRSSGSGACREYYVRP